MADDLLLSSATDLAARLKSREISSEELLGKTLTRIEKLNPAINAVIAQDVEGARRDAARADANLKAGNGGALEGLVITIKDSIDVAGLPATCGAPIHRDRIADTDAPAVARLRQAGAVILGKTNVPIFTGDFQSFNSLFGVTNNPWDLTRSPGGSSGGAAAAVATGMSAFEVGSDFGGSIRWPAHACGVFGHRPTYGLVSARGHVPPQPGSLIDPAFATLGPLARSAQDLALILDIIHGPAAVDGARAKLERYAPATPSALRVAVWADDPEAPVDAEVSAAVRHAAQLLKDAGAHVDELARPDFVFAEELDTFSLFNHAIMAVGFPEEVRTRLAAKAKELAPGDRSHRAMQARGAKIDAETWAALERRKKEIIAAWQAFFTTYDVLLCPPAPVAAIPHEHQPGFHSRVLMVNGTERPYFDFLYWSSFASLAGLPASAAPIGRTASGLPVGVQIVSAPGNDMKTIACAGLLERLGPGFIAPPI